MTCPGGQLQHCWRTQLHGAFGGVRPPEYPFATGQEMVDD